MEDGVLSATPPLTPAHREVTMVPSSDIGALLLAPPALVNLFRAPLWIRLAWWFSVLTRCTSSNTPMSLAFGFLLPLSSWNAGVSSSLTWVSPSCASRIVQMV